MSSTKRQLRNLHSKVECNTRKNRCNNYVIHTKSDRLDEYFNHSRTVDTNHYRLFSHTHAGKKKLIALLVITIPIYMILSAELISTSSDLPPLPNHLTPNSDDNHLLDDCEACKLVVESFEKGMEKTMRGKHEGGDTSWEEKNLKNYADSEVRLVEIQEDFLCNDVTKSKTQCFSLVEEAEQHIEDWWFKDRRNNVRLHDYLCINKLKKCCTDGAYGPTCQPCPSDCNRHGICDGSGTRSGSGECICNPGYMGAQCEECQQDYFMVQTQNAQSPSRKNQFSCLACHSACSGGCSGPSTVNCTECKPGYYRDPITKQCNDINECELSSDGLSVEAEKLCPDGTYCLNTEGHYRCASCHQACSTCLAYGRDKCIACASDFFMDEEHNCIYTRDYNRHDPNMRDDENVLAYIWRRFQTDIVLKIMLNILLYPLVRWIVEKVNRGSTFIRKVIIFLATINLQMEIYPFVHKMIITNFGKNLNETNPGPTSDDFDVLNNLPSNEEL